ncbi:hypothetical protein G6L37_06840 [Agrobacterium rubi]|nr:hypothetical protein [Agrobacterium rubi]NTF25081.1 hypothetical protein [Agrobacterium rubi]
MTADKKSRLSKDLSILMNLGKEDDGSREPPFTHEGLAVISAKVQVGDAVYIERSVCTDDIPAEAIGETVTGVLQQIHAAGIDVMKQTVTITFGAMSELDN